MATDGLDRRDFLTLSATGIAGSQLLLPAPALGDVEPPSSVGIVDTHLYLGRWPFRQTPGNSSAETIAMLRKNGVGHGWAGTFEGLLHKDVSGANARLAEACRRDSGGVPVPFGAVNPMLPDWEEDVRRCHEMFKMPGIRLHPTYHGYSLADERFANLLALATKRKLIVQLVAQLDEERHAYLRMPAAQVDITPLAAVVQRFPELRLTLHNGLKPIDGAQLGVLTTAPNTYFDVTAVAGSDEIPVDRLVLGSCWPLGNVASALIRAREATASDVDAQAIRQGTASRLLLLAAGSEDAAQ